MLAKVTPYRVKDAAIDAAQYVQNSPGNLDFSVKASAMLVPAIIDEPARGAAPSYMGPLAHAPLGSVLRGPSCVLKTPQGS